MEIVERILGTYIPVCCLSIPALVFFALAAALPAAFLALTSQEGKKEEERIGEPGIGEEGN